VKSLSAEVLAACRKARAALGTDVAVLSHPWLTVSCIRIEHAHPVRFGSSVLYQTNSQISGFPSAASLARAIARCSHGGSLMRVPS